MRVLLDTHALLWFLLGDAKLSPVAEELIRRPDNEVLVSPASYWEIAIKISLGKYCLPEPLAQFMTRELVRNRFNILPILPSHAERLVHLPFHHRDPFDRLIVAQALEDGLALVSADRILDLYAVPRIW